MSQPIPAMHSRLLVLDLDPLLLRLPLTQCHAARRVSHSGRSSPIMSHSRNICQPCHASCRRPHQASRGAYWYNLPCSLSHVPLTRHKGVKGAREVCAVTLARSCHCTNRTVAPCCVRVGGWACSETNHAPLRVQRRQHAKCQESTFSLPSLGCLSHAGLFVPQVSGL